MVGSIYNEVPWAAVPVIVAAKNQHSGSFQVEGHVEFVRELIQKMRCIRSLIAAATIVGAAHVGAHANSLISPVIP